MTNVMDILVLIAWYCAHYWLSRGCLIRGDRESLGGGQCDGPGPHAWLYYLRTYLLATQLLHNMYCGVLAKV